MTKEKFERKLKVTTTDTQAIFVCQDGTMTVMLHYDSQNPLHRTYFFVIDRLGAQKYKVLNMDTENEEILAMYDYITTNNCSQQVVIKHNGIMQVDNIINAIYKSSSILALDKIYDVLNISDFSEHDWDFIELAYGNMQDKLEVANWKKLEAELNEERDWTKDCSQW